MFSYDSDHIKVEGHSGTWCAIDESWAQITPDVDGEPKTIPAHRFLLERETYGDEAAGVIVNEARGAAAQGRLQRL